MMFNPQSNESSTLTSREAFLSMLERLPGALFVVDDAETIVYANASAQTMLGASREAFLGNLFWRGAPQLVSSLLYQAVLKSRQTQEPTEVEYWSPMTQTWLHVRLAPTVGGLMVQFHEMREPTPRQETFSQREHLFSEGLDSLHAHIGLLTPEGMLLEINETPLEAAHIRREEVIGKPLAEAPWWSCSPVSQEHLRQAIARAGRGETVRFDAMIHPRGGMNLDLEATITPHVDPDHHIEYLIYAATDVTAHKHTEDELRVLIDAIPQLVWTGRPDGYVDSYSQGWRDYTGLTTEQAQGDGWMSCLHLDDQQRIQAVWQSAIQTGRPYEAEQRMRSGTTGAYRWFLVRAVPLKDCQGVIRKWFGTCTDIEEQKRAEQQLKTSEENWRVLAETVPQLVWTTRPDGRLDYCNQRFCEYTHAAFAQLQGYGWRQFLHPEDIERVVALRHQTLETGEAYESEYRLRNGQTGTYRWFLARSMPVRDETGHIVKWFGTCTDIHDKKQAEDDIRVLVDAIPQFVWVMRPDGSAEYSNQQWRDYTTMTSEQLQRDGWIACLHPDDRQRTQEAWRTSIQTGAPYEVEQRLRNGTTGDYRWFLARGMPLKDSQGTTLKWFGTSTDIEEQKQAEQRIKTSEENWRVLAETVPQLVWVARPDGQFEYTNQRWCTYTGLTLEPGQSDQWAHRQCIHPDDREDNRVRCQHTLETGEMFEHEHRVRNSQTGEYRWFLTRGMPVRDETGQLVKWFGTSTDIEDQKRLEAALRQSQERVNALMNSSIIGIVITEGEQIVDANDTFLRMTSYTREDLREERMNWRHMTPPEYLARTQQAQQELAVQQSMIPYEKEYVCKDGSRLPVLVGGVVLEHHPLQDIYFVLDNSARKELEQRKDAFISMASHELRNPLTALKLQAILLHRQLAKQGMLASAPALSSMQTQINTVSRLVEELLNVSKIQAGRLEYVRETVDLDTLLHEVTDTMQQISPTHTIVLRGTASCSLVGDKDRLGQVFINLISNAIKYSPGAETVEVDLSASAETATIRVRDYGLGIPQEQRDKIFERFHRISGPSHKAIPGLGMGLYIVAEIVRHYEGAITVESEVGKGSTFQVTLPKKRDG